MKEEVESLNEISSKRSRKMLESNITHNLIWQNIRITLRISMTYKLKETTIIKTQSRSKESCIYKGILPRVGAMRLLPLPYRFVPQKYIIMDLPRIINFQVTTQITHLLQHVTAPTTVEQMFII